MNTAKPVATATLAAVKKATERANALGFYTAVKSAGFDDAAAEKALKKDYIGKLQPKRASICAGLAEAILGRESKVFPKTSQPVAA